MLWLYILIVVLIMLFVTIFIISNNNFRLAKMKLDKADEDIKIYLNKKYELLERTKPIIMKELKLDSFLDNLEKFDKDDANMNSNNLLKSCYNELFKVLDDHEKLFKSNALVQVLDELNDNEENVIGSIKYYNDNVVTYNHLVLSFPSNIIALFTGNKKLDFYNNEKREMFEILNKK